jgi:hypothetical protein
MNLQTHGTKDGDKYNQAHGEKNILGDSREPGRNSCQWRLPQDNTEYAETYGLRQCSLLCQVGKKTRHENNSITIRPCLYVSLFLQCSSFIRLRDTTSWGVMSVQTPYK